MIYTPHINANKEDIAKIVVMPGDPKRSKLIADTYLDNPILINDIRGIQGYTGLYKGKKITVMASGIGNSSMGIYSYELFNSFDVNTIIRVGTSGSLKEDINLKDVVIAEEILTNTNYNQLIQKNIHNLKASENLIKNLKDITKDKDNAFKFGKVYSTDTFYNDLDQDYFTSQGALVVEMETAALYENARNFNRNAVAIYTVTDHLITNERLDAIDRETDTQKMFDLAFNLIERID